MLDLFAVVSTGGVVLWMHSAQDRDVRAVVSQFMQLVVIDNAVAGSTLVLGALELRWTIHHELCLVFLAAYPKILPLTHVPTLLEHVKTYVARTCGPLLRDDPPRWIDELDRAFEPLCRRAEQGEAEERRSKGAAQRAKAGQRGKDPERGAKGERGEGGAKTEKREKTMRDWGDRVKQEALERLDLSDDKGAAQTADRPCSVGKEKSAQHDFALLKDIGWEMGEDGGQDEAKAGIGGSGSSGLWRYFDSITGQRQLERADLEPAKALLKEHLVGKNVASEVAEHICNSVAESLVGRRTGAFQSVHSLVVRATEEAVGRILRPQAAFDLLEEVRLVCSGPARRPYVMAFVGVNGVGKSTNLSKVCFWLLQNRMRVLVVAGDTFRSGAVEQLSTHVRNLSSGYDASSIQLFERGYGKDAATIAKDGISYARAEGFDVVMIDTAGRMQDNAPLMMALAKLIHTNHPDKVIFVGEALVGNEAVDQLKKFNAAIGNHTSSRSPAAKIDGILLTKFDTIDDKVGAALSMTFIANAPILFVGVGQTYTDLRKMSVQAVVSALLK